MGILDAYKRTNMANKAYRLHVTGNQSIKKGNLQAARDQHARALDLYEQSYTMGHRVPQHVLSFCILLLRAGKPERARDILLELNKNPKITKAQKFDLRVDYAISQWKLGNLDTAIETLRRAEKSQGKSSQVYTILGMILMDKARQTGDYAEAIAYNAEALDYDDEDAATLDNMGWLNLALRDIDLREGRDNEAVQKREEAKKFFARAHEQDPRQVTTCYALAKLNMEDGDLDTAREMIQMAEENRLSEICPVTSQQIQELKAQIG